MINLQFNKTVNLQGLTFENILSKSIEMEWPVTAPDKELRK